MFRTGSGREPYGDVSRLESLADHAGQVISHGVQVYGPAQPRVECCHDRLGIIAGPVEPAVNYPLRAYGV